MSAPLAAPLQIGSSSLSGRRRVVVHALWWITLATVVGMNLVSIPANLQVLQRPCVGPQCVSQQLNLFQWRSWVLAGLTPANYAAIALAFTLVIALVYIGVAVVLFRVKPDNRMVLYTSFTFILFGGVSFPEAVSVLAAQNPLWALPVLTLEFLGTVLFFGMFCLFPNGQFVPRWSRFILGLWAIEQVLAVLARSQLNIQWLPDWVRDFSFLAMTGAVVAAQIYRYRYVSHAQERRQTRWVVYGSVMSFAAFGLTVLFFETFTNTRLEGLENVILGVLVGLLICIPPISVAIALLRSHLWDIDLIINRTLVYVPMTAILAGVLAVSSELTQKVFVALTGEKSDVAPIFSTLIVVAAFEPVKHTLQDLVDRHFKQAPNPAKNLYAFGEQVSAVSQVMDSHALTQRLLQEAAQAFDASSGALYLGADATTQPVHTVGEWKGDSAITVPVTDRQQVLGRLELGARRNGDAYTDADAVALRRTADRVAHMLTLLQQVKPDSAVLTETFHADSHLG